MQRDMLALSFQTARMTIAANLAGLTHEQSLQQPSLAGNCVNWLAGHLLVSRAGLMQILKIEGESSLTTGETDSYRQGSAPLRSPDRAVRLERLVAGLEKSGARIVSRIGSVSESELGTLLDPKMFPGPVDQPSLANLLTLFLFHEAYHSGQIGLGRRLLGQASGIRI